jgi:toxin HigB-1
MPVDLDKRFVYYLVMIVSYGNKETEKLHKGQKSRLLPADIIKRAVMRLDRIDAATSIEDLLFPPSHHLEKLSGGREGQWSIRVNDQWRVCFTFENGKAYQVEVIDYH